MYHFDYVDKTEWKSVYDQIIEIIHQVQDDVRDKFTFQYRFIGSTSLGMITCDKRSNIGFDFDINIYPNDENQDYTAEELKHILMNSFNKFISPYGFNNCQDSTRVFTMKYVDRTNSRVKHSCDFAVVYDCPDGRQQYIRYNKEQNSYYWEFQPEGYYDLENKIKWLKKNGYWNDVRNLYLEKKNNNDNPDKKSRSLRAEAINEIVQYYGY